MHYYKLKSQDQSELQTSINEGMEWALNPNFTYSQENPIDILSSGQSIQINGMFFRSVDFTKISQDTYNTMRSKCYYRIENTERYDTELIKSFNDRKKIIDIVSLINATFLFSYNCSPVDIYVSDLKTPLIDTKFRYVFKSLISRKLDTYITDNMDYMLKENFAFILDNEINRDTEELIEYDGYEIEVSDLVLDDNKSNFKPEPEVEEGTWSSVSSTDYLFHDYLKEQIKSRYAFLDRVQNGTSNLVVDSLFPKLMYRNNMKIINNLGANYGLAKTSVAISPFIARALNVKQMETEQLIRLLGYTRKDIKNKLQAVKKKSLSVVFVGAGGTGVNTIHWLSELCKLTNEMNIFKKTITYENDKVEISNLFRFPIDPSTINNRSSHKSSLIKDDIERLSESNYLKITYLNKKETIYSSSFVSYYNDDGTIVKDEEGIPIRKTKKKTILYGAPDIETRKLLSSCGSFISATHSDTSCYMYLNPQQDDLIQVESYGMIQLSPFFMNQLKMAITFLDILADDELDLSEQDKELLSCSFSTQDKITTDRTYNFQIESNVTMSE